jgi:hypothetical protein
MAQICKVKLFLKSLLPGFKFLERAQVGYRDLFAFVDVSQSMHCVSFDLFIPVLLCIIIASVVDATCFYEGCPLISNGFGRWGVCSKNTEILPSSIPVWVDIVHG